MAFQHVQASHCESGVMSSLLRHHGLALSEPMAFGLASALALAYLPFIRLNGLPLIAYRMPPGAIVRGLDRGLQLGVRFETFRSSEAGMARLDALLDEGKVVGLQTSIYWLPYIPPDLRFHFNAHNLLVYGREGDEYLVSDPVAENMTLRLPVRAGPRTIAVTFLKKTTVPEGVGPSRLPAASFGYSAGKFTSTEFGATRMVSSPRTKRTRPLRPVRMVSPDCRIACWFSETCCAPPPRFAYCRPRA